MAKPDTELNLEAADMAKPVKEIDYIAIGRRLRKAREDKELSQEQLAALIDASSQHISNIENGHTIGSMKTIIRIANALETTTDSLLYDNITVLYESYDKDFKDLLKDCTVKERQIIYESAQQLIRSMRNNK